jgi:hypothetical protein
MTTNTNHLGLSDSTRTEAVETAPARIEAEIAETRANMAGTLSALSRQLEPSELKEKLRPELQHIEERVREVVQDQLETAKTAVKEELIHAKGIIREELNVAEDKIKRGLIEAKESVKTDIKDAYEDVKTNVRAATIGRVEDLATTLGDTMNETRETLFETIKANPLPAAVAGFGLAWLLMNRSKNVGRGRGSSNSGDARRGNAGSPFGTDGSWERNEGRAGGIVEDLRSAVSSGAHQASEAMHQVAGSASDLAGRVAHTASDASSIAHGAEQFGSSVAHGAQQVGSTISKGAQQLGSTISHGATDAAGFVAENATTLAHNVKRGVDTTMRDNPLVLGGVAFTVGAVVGLALPATQRENQLIGKTRDRVLKGMGEAAQDAVQQVVSLTEKGAETATRAMTGGREA